MISIGPARGGASVAMNRRHAKVSGRGRARRLRHDAPPSTDSSTLASGVWPLHAWPRTSERRAGRRKTLARRGDHRAHRHVGDHLEQRGVRSASARCQRPHGHARQAGECRLSMRSPSCYAVVGSRCRVIPFLRRRGRESPARSTRSGPPMLRRDRLAVDAPRRPASRARAPWRSAGRLLTARAAAVEAQVRAVVPGDVDGAMASSRWAASRSASRTPVQATQPAAPCCHSTTPAGAGRTSAPLPAHSSTAVRVAVSSCRCSSRIVQRRALRTQPSIASVQVAMSAAPAIGIVPVLRANRRRTGVMSSSSRWTGVSAFSSTVGRRRRSGFSAAVSARCSSGDMKEPPVIARSPIGRRAISAGFAAEIASLLAMTTAIAYVGAMSETAAPPARDQRQFPELPRRRPRHRRAAGQPRHARRARHRFGAALSRRVPVRPPGDRATGSRAGGSSSTASSCRSVRAARPAITRRSGNHEQERDRRSRPSPARRPKSSADAELLGRPSVVDWAMRYGNPSIASRLGALAAAGLRPHPRSCRSIRNMPRRRARRCATRRSVRFRRCAGSRRCALRRPITTIRVYIDALAQLARQRQLATPAVHARGDHRLVPRHSPGLFRQGRSVLLPMRRRPTRLLRERLGSTRPS